MTLDERIEKLIVLKWKAPSDAEVLLTGFEVAWAKSGCGPAQEYLRELSDADLRRMIDAAYFPAVYRMIFAADDTQRARICDAAGIEK